MNKMQRNVLFSIFKIVLTFALLTGLFIHVDFSQLLNVFSQFRANTLFLVIILTYLALFVNAVKWHLLLPEYKIATLFNFNLVAVYYSLILPGQFLGELAKAYYFGRGKQDAEKIAASIVVDKITGFIGILFVGLFGIHTTVQSLPTILNVSFQIIALCLILGLLSVKILLVLLVQLKRVSRFQQTSSSLNRLFDAWLIYLKMPRLLLNSVLLGSFFQLMCVAIVAVLANGLGLSVSWVDWCWIFSVVSLAVFLPLTIAGIGIREGAFVGTLSLLDIPLEKGLALSFSLFGLNLLTALVGGLIELNRVKTEVT